MKEDKHVRLYRALLLSFVVAILFGCAGAGAGGDSDTATSSSGRLKSAPSDRDSFVAAGGSGSEDEFFDSSYSSLSAGSPLIAASDPNFQWYEVDITTFINERIADYQADPSQSVVFIMLRPDTTYDGGSTSYKIGSGNDSSYEPYIEIRQ